jgi:Tfp pilus assembly protein PilF
MGHHVRAWVTSLRARIADSGRWRLLWAAVGALATIGGVIGIFDWGYSRFVEDPREEKRHEQLERKIDELTAQLLAGASTQLPGQQQQVSEAVAAATEGARAGDAQFARATELLKVGKTEDAAALFRAVAKEKTQRIEQDRLEAAAAWRHAGAIAGLADPKTARDAYRRAVELQPDNAEAQLWHGWFEKEAGGLAAADAAFRRVLALAEQGPPATQRPCGRGWASATC